MGERIPVWRIGEHALCPRRNYFLDEHGGGSRPLEYEVVLRRREALEEAGSLETAPLREALLDMVERVEEEYPRVWGEEPQPLPERWVALEAAAVVDRHDGYEAALEAQIAETGVELASDDSGLVGRLDGITEEGVPVMLRTGSPPSNGVWRPDRARAAAYCILLEEEGIEADRVAVEYLGDYVRRETEVRPYHRRKVLETRRRVRKTLRENVMPKKRNETLCPSCDFEESCDQEPTSLKEKLFG